MRQRSDCRGFTLIELIIVVAIFGILATVAVPNFIRLQLRSRVGEAQTNLAGMRSAELARYAESGRYVRAGSAPAGAPGPQRRPWSGGNVLEFRELLGWIPEGEVYFQYGANAEPEAFTLTAVSDLDGDGLLGQFGVLHRAEGEAVGLSGEVGTCSQKGVYNPSTGRADLFDVIGPCGASDGRSHF